MLLKLSSPSHELDWIMLGLSVSTSNLLCRVVVGIKKEETMSSLEKGWDRNVLNINSITVITFSEEVN